MKGDEICLTIEMINDIISKHFDRSLKLTAFENADDNLTILNEDKFILVMEETE